MLIIFCKYSICVAFFELQNTLHLLLLEYKGMGKGSKFKYVTSCESCTCYCEGGSTLISGEVDCYVICIHSGLLPCGWTRTVNWRSFPLADTEWRDDILLADISCGHITFSVSLAINKMIFRIFLLSAREWETARIIFGAIVSKLKSESDAETCIVVSQWVSQRMCVTCCGAMVVEETRFF